MKIMNFYIVCLLIAIYLLAGLFFCGAITDSAGKPMKSMIILWAVYIPILIAYKIIDLAFKLGEFIGNTIRKI